MHCEWFTEKNLFHPHFLDQMHAQVIADAPMKKLRGHVKKTENLHISTRQTVTVTTCLVYHMTGHLQSLGVICPWYGATIWDFQS